MKLLAIMQTPWQANYPASRATAMVLYVSAAIGALAIALFASGDQTWRLASGCYAIGLFFTWAFFFPAGLLLAMDARLLRMPGVHRRVLQSLLLYGLLTVLLPAPILIALCGWRAAPCLVIFALCAVGGLNFSLLPRYVAVFVGLCPSFFDALTKRWEIGALIGPHLVALGAMLALGLLALVALRWRALLQGTVAASGWTAPLVTQWRQGSWGTLNRMGRTQPLRQLPAWLQAQADITATALQWPRKALRIALGGWYLPQTAKSYAKQLSLLPLFMLPSLGALLVLSGTHRGDTTEVLEGILIGLSASFVVLAGPMIALLTFIYLQRRWSRTHAEVALLALLPGIGNGVQLKRRLLRVSLGLPLVLHALLLGLVWLGVALYPDHRQPLVLLLLAQLAAATFSVALVLSLFGDRAPSLWAVGGIAAISFALNIGSILVTLLGWQQRTPAWMAEVVPTWLLGWLLFVLGMAWLARRGWLALQERPHPFLPFTSNAD
ncbi:MAG: hypothetical protein ABW154_03965 [Dyella sp.]